MRVTKLIREYVEKSVRAIYEPKIKAIDEECQARKEALKVRLDAFIEQIDTTVMKMFVDAGFEEIYSSKHYLQSYGNTYLYRIEKERIDKTVALTTEMREKVNDILLNLELGATRAELDEMIKNLM